MTQSTLALAVGASKAVVYQMEMGLIREPSAKLAIRLARALGTTVEYLVNGQGSPPSKAEVRKAYMQYTSAQRDEKAEKLKKAS